MAWVERMIPSDRDEQFESWRKEFQQERMLRIVREREIMKETAKRCKAYQTREQEANDAIERKRQVILAQRKASTVQATMRFQRGLHGFTVMDPEKFDRAIETITGRQASNRSTPRRPSIGQQRAKPNTTFRRSISMEELASTQQPSVNHYPRSDQRNRTMLTRTNSATQLPQFQTTVQYTSPLQEVQRRVLTDFAAQVQSTLNHQPTPPPRPSLQHHHQQQQQQHFEEVNTWERESVDSLETADRHSHPRQFVSPMKVMGPIVQSNPVVQIQPKHRPPVTSLFAVEPMSTQDQQEMLRRSYHESFFVKNTPVTGDEQVKAWLGATRNPPAEKTPPLDDNDSETNGKIRSILKRSPSADSSGTTGTAPVAPRKASVPQPRSVGSRTRVKDSLEVINSKLLKDLDPQKKTVRFAHDSNSERCASDTQLIKQTETDNDQVLLRRAQSAAILTPPSNPRPAKQILSNDDRASECSSTTSSKPPVYPSSTLANVRHGYTTIGLKQRELRTKLHKTRYAQSLRQTNTSPIGSDSPSRRTSTPHSQQPLTPNKTSGCNGVDDDENESIFSELRMSSAPSSHFSQNDARLPPPAPSSKITVEQKLNGTKNIIPQAPVSLSVEERRVQESLDRLDRQLREVQTRTRSHSGGGSRTEKNQKR